MLVEGTVRKPVTIASPAPDDDARPFAANPSIAAPRRSQRTDHELVGETISIQWVFDDDARASYGSQRGAVRRQGQCLVRCGGAEGDSQAG